MHQRLFGPTQDNLIAERVLNKDSTGRAGRVQALSSHAVRLSSLASVRRAHMMVPTEPGTAPFTSNTSASQTLGHVPVKSVFGSGVPTEAGVEAPSIGDLVRHEAADNRSLDVLLFIRVENRLCQTLRKLLHIIESLLGGPQSKAAH